MDMFSEIDKEKVELPSFIDLFKKVKKHKFNFYQLFAIFFFCILFILGIILGNVFPLCEGVSLNDLKCSSTEFNFSLMLTVWFSGFLISVVLFAIGEIIYWLKEIAGSLKSSK